MGRVSGHRPQWRVSGPELPPRLEEHRGFSTEWNQNTRESPAGTTHACPCPGWPCRLTGQWPSGHLFWTRQSSRPWERSGSQRSTPKEPESNVPGAQNHVRGKSPTAGAGMRSHWPPQGQGSPVCPELRPRQTRSFHSRQSKQQLHKQNSVGGTQCVPWPWQGQSRFWVQLGQLQLRPSWGALHEDSAEAVQPQVQLHLGPWL